MDKEEGEKEDLTVALQMRNTERNDMKQKMVAIERDLNDTRQMVVDMERELNAARLTLTVSGVLSIAALCVHVC